MVPAKPRSSRLRGAQSRTTVALGALAVLAAVAIMLPARAPAGQSSQATSAPVAQVAAGVYHSCALLDDGTTPAPPGRPVRCWGFSGDGQVGYGNTNVIGDDETPGSVGPVDLGAGRTAKALAVGDYHTCAALDDGSVRCWGYGNEGQLGYGNRNQIGDNEAPGSVGPVNLGTGRTATAITGGGNHTCALLDDGNVRCWGLGEFGQLGYGNTTSIGDSEDPGAAGPVNLAGQTAKAITAGAFHTCAILDNDSVRCWGLNTNGQLGYANTSAVVDPSQVASPVDLGQGRTAKAITAGFAHTCAVLNDASVRCWGLNDSGQLGYGNTTNIGDNEPPGSVVPVDLGAGRTATAISAGGDHTCAVLDGGSVRCWGSPLFGQLGYANVSAVGDNESPGSVGPVELGSGRTATAISAGTHHTCARLDDNSVRCWGNGADGRLGHCDAVTVGDDETPGSIGPVDVGAGGAGCPPVSPPSASTPPATSGGADVAPPPAPAAGPVTAPSGDAEALRVETMRADGLRDCRAAVLSQERRGRSRALRRYRRSPRVRALVLRKVSSRSAQGRARCLRRFGRTPGRVTTLAARAGSGGKIILTFGAPGSDGSTAPAARRYLIKQSLRPIRTAPEFQRAHALCKGACTFAVTKLEAAITLEVTQLRRNTTYYYKIAARDNVSKRTGPRSKTVLAKTR